MSVPVPLDELASVLEQRSNAAYLLTVGEDGTAHCVTTTVAWLDDDLVVPAGRTSVRNAAARGHVVLLSPPPSGLAAPPPDDDGESHGDYSLIVDARVTASSSGDGAVDSTVRARPVHAVLHRPAVAPDGRRGHDCLHLYDQA